MVCWNSDHNHWTITFLRHLNDWEEEGVLSLLALLTNTKFAFDRDNEILWPHDSSRQFTIKSHWEEMYEGSSQLHFPAEAIGKSKALPKLAF